MEDSFLYNSLSINETTKILLFLFAFAISFDKSRNFFEILLENPVCISKSIAIIIYFKNYLIF